jgi:hypothetical protein
MLHRSIFVFSCKVTRGEEGPIDPPDGGEIIPVRTARIKSPMRNHRALLFSLI